MLSRRLHQVLRNHADSTNGLSENTSMRCNDANALSVPRARDVLVHLMSVVVGKITLAVATLLSFLQHNVFTNLQHNIVASTSKSGLCVCVCVPVAGNIHIDTVHTAAAAADLQSRFLYFGKPFSFYIYFFAPQIKLSCRGGRRTGRPAELCPLGKRCLVLVTSSSQSPPAPA
jgi:hypothetical protein